MDAGDVNDVNGLCFNGCQLAKESISHILSFADVPTLANCRLVCHFWKWLVDDPFLWKAKTLRERKTWPKPPMDPSLPWAFYAQICTKEPYARNLILNPCGREQSKHWNVLSNGGDGFAYECPPVYCDKVPDEVEKLTGVFNTCFATSYHSCSLEQVVDLVKIGIPALILDEIKPTIIISEWYAGRYDCGCVYECQFDLLDKDLKTLDSFRCRKTLKQWTGREWHKVEHLFVNYPVGVRFIKFYHGGTDTQFWAGHYGSKFTGASVVISFGQRTAPVDDDENESVEVK